MDLVYNSASLMPLRLVLSGMKEVTRTWKVLAGVNQAHKKYKDALLVMIAVGWAKGQSLVTRARGDINKNSGGYLFISDQTCFVPVAPHPQQVPEAD